jgi:hypothetical protein
LPVPLKADLTFQLIERKVEVTGRAEGLNGPADNVELRLAVSRDSEH